jgi:hypothetical protein
MSPVTIAAAAIRMRMKQPKAFDFTSSGAGAVKTGLIVATAGSKIRAVSGEKVRISGVADSAVGGVKYARI